MATADATLLGTRSGPQLQQPPQLQSHVQPPQLESLHETDGHSSDSDSGAISFKYPPAFKELQKCIDKFSSKSDENDVEIWLGDFTEATTDCMWTDIERARWLSWFLAGSAKVTWQRTVKSEDKTSWQKIRSCNVLRPIWCPHGSKNCLPMLP